MADGAPPLGSRPHTRKRWPIPNFQSDKPFEVSLALQPLGICMFPTAGVKLSRHGPICACPLGARCHKGIGKHPSILSWPTEATTDRDKLREWWVRWPTSNFSAACGRRSGIWVLDVDGPKGFESLAKLEAELGPLPATWRTESGSGLGGHYWFALPPTDPEVRNSASRIAPNVDVRGKGGQILIPGSLHRSGKRYRWLDGCSPNDVPLASAPDAWMEAALAANSKSIGPSPRPSAPKALPKRGNVSEGPTKGSNILGEGPGRGSFNGPINSIFIRLFMETGLSCPDELAIALVEHLVRQAPTGDPQKLERYLSLNHLTDACASARAFAEKELS